MATIQMEMSVALKLSSNMTIFKRTLIYASCVLFGFMSKQANAGSSWVYSRYTDEIKDEVIVSSVSKAKNRFFRREGVKNIVLKVTYSMKPGSTKYSQSILIIPVSSNLDCGKKFDKCRAKVKFKSGPVIEFGVLPLEDSIFKGSPGVYFFTKDEPLEKPFFDYSFVESFVLEIIEKNGERSQFKFDAQEKPWFHYLYIGPDFQISKDDMKRLFDIREDFQ